MVTFLQQLLSLFAVFLQANFMIIQRLPFDQRLKVGYENSF